jgi:hypothetical protein
MKNTIEPPPNMALKARSQCDGKSCIAGGSSRRKSSCYQSVGGQPFYRATSTIPRTKVVPFHPPNRGLTIHSSRLLRDGLTGVGPQSFAELFNVIGATPLGNVLNPVRGFTCCRYVPSKPAASGIASRPVPLKRQHFFPRKLPLQPVQHFASPGQRPNNSFKPTPTARLNSGVMC